MSLFYVVLDVVSKLAYAGVVGFTCYTYRLWVFICFVKCVDMLMYMFLV